MNSLQKKLYLDEFKIFLVHNLFIYLRFNQTKNWKYLIQLRNNEALEGKFEIDNVNTMFRVAFDR